MGPSELVVYADPNYISCLQTLKKSYAGKVGEFTSSLSPMNGYELPLNMYYADARGLANCPTCGDFAKAGMNPDGTWKSDPSVPVAVEEEPLVAVKKPCGACSGAGGPYEVPLTGASPLAQVHAPVRPPLPPPPILSPSPRTACVEALSAAPEPPRRSRSSASSRAWASASVMTTTIEGLNETRRGVPAFPLAAGHTRPRPGQRSPREARS